MLRSLIATPLILVVGASASAVARAPEKCMAGMRKVLTEGHFSGPIVCTPGDATFTLVGKTVKGGFSIYDYRYRYRPEHGNVDHGGQRIIVFHGGKYLGQYSASPPPHVRLSVRGSVLRIAGMPGKRDMTLDFSYGPPRKALIGGVESGFFR